MEGIEVDRVAGRPTGDFSTVTTVTTAGANPQLGTFLQTLHKTIRSLEHRYEEQRRLHEATTRANHGVMLDDILEHSYQAFRPLLPYERIGLALLEDQGRSLRLRWVRTESESPRLKPGDLIPLRGQRLQTILEAGRPRVLEDLTAYLARHPDSIVTRLLVEEGFRSTLACPLISTGKPLGFLFFSSSRPSADDQEHVELFGQLAGDVSVIVEKGRMYEDLQRSHERLEAEVQALARTEQALRQTQAELEAANKVLAALAATDGLTGVANRRAFDETLDREWRRAIRNNLPIALVMIDIDAFKLFNDTLGHLQGDDCLRDVAEALRSAVMRPCDLVARYGGEEFAILLPETGRDPAVMLGERMRAAIEAMGIAHPSSPVAAVVTASLGVASARPKQGEAPPSLVKAADEALYLAKQNGRNRVAVAAVAEA
jgi:diguanylate cyclase (GGDEF)-like protein